MNRLVVRQYRASEPFAPDPDVLRALAIDFRTKVDLRPTADGLITVAGNANVGVIRAGTLDVIIQPRVPTLSVFWMLGYAYRTAKLLPDDFTVDVESGLLDVLARLFARQTERLIRRGLYREYVERDDTLRFIRGRIIPLEDVRRNLGLHHIVACRYTDLTADVLHNQVLRAVTELLLRFRFASPGITELLAWNLSHLGEVSTVRVGERDVAGLRYGRLNERYQPVHALARLVLRHLSFALDQGAERTPAFLVNMNSVYQEFLAALIEEQVRPLGLRVLRELPYGLDIAGSVTLRPDIVVADAHSVRAVIDAKYKPEIAEADVYQALAYATALRQRSVALVYPADAIEPRSIVIRNSDVAVLVRTIPVVRDQGTFSDLDRRARAAALEIVMELAVNGGELRPSAEIVA